MKSKYLLPIALTIAASATALHAASVIDATTAKPTIGADDVYNYVATPGVSRGSQDYTNNYSNGFGAPGETFTATSSGSLTSLTLQGLQGGAGNGYQTGTFTLNIYSVGSNGTDLTSLENVAFTFADKTGATDYSGDYLTFNLPTAISLTSGNVYAFTFAGPAGYYALAGSYPANSYTGGSAITTVTTVTGGVKTTDPSIAINQSYTYDRNFDAHIEAVPEPRTWAMLAGGLLFLVALCRRRLA